MKIGKPIKKENLKTPYFQFNGSLKNPHPAIMVKTISFSTIQVRVPNLNVPNLCHSYSTVII
jgi:hypothetical protein